MQIAALFAGIGGLELGLHQKGHETKLFCEIDPGAQATLAARFPNSELVADVREIERLSGIDLVTAGFPCQDLSQAGRTAGIGGNKSGIVDHLFRILERSDVPHVLIENVPFMLRLGRGQAIRYVVSELERLGYRWAYRVVDAQAFGIPQRRERVYLLASRSHDPKHTMFAESHAPVSREFAPNLACGFYWTEGVRGLGWAVDGVPTIKGGSTVGIASPPAIWMPQGGIVTPHICDGERLQGFPADWTLPSEAVVRRGHRWKMVGNAVCAKASEWLGEVIGRLDEATSVPRLECEFDQEKGWPTAAFGGPKSPRQTVEISKWPASCPRVSLASFLQFPTKDLSLRATEGFMKRLEKGRLRYRPEFWLALERHRESMLGLKRVA